MKRKQMRDLAFQLLYQMEIQRETPDHILEIAYEEQPVDEAARGFISNIVLGVAEHGAQIDQLIAHNAQGWSLGRISKIVLSALRLAIFEMMYCEDIPDTVAINEAVDLVKLYVGEDSTGFVNGVLAAVLKGKAAPQS